MKRKIMILVMAALASTMLAATAASASHDGGWYGGDEPQRAVSYINPDNGAATGITTVWWTPSRYATATS
ncbi:MAG: hypothetical protein WKF95_10655, partial [Rubrobacter sp.]